MRLVKQYVLSLSAAARDGWNHFWFTPADPATLALIRVAAGAMLLYTHLVWTLDLEAFFGPHSWVSPAAAATVLRDPDGGGYAWSHFWIIRGPFALWTAHLAALVLFAMLMLGLFSRVVSVLAYLAAVGYVNRIPGAQFGLDQINVMLAMYLMIGPSGAAWSLDRLWAARRAGHSLPPAQPAVSANLAVRLIQVHMCVIYFYAALAKLGGITWFSGEAIWYAVANLEYQTLDMTWLARWPLLIALITQVTLYWELSFCVLVWPRLIRPLVLLMGVPVHLGIAFCMGMITFGLVMLIGCLSFVPPDLVRRLLRFPSDRKAGQARTDPIHGARRLVAAPPKQPSK
ncbi:MAG: HTTM domain-containing protein [Pirellulales bacterium]